MCRVGEAIRATPLQYVSCFTAFCTSVTQMHVSVPHAADGRSMVREAVGQSIRCLALNLQTWSRGRCISELSCLFLQFSLHVYNIAINSTGGEIPSKNVAYSYQAMS